MADNNDQFEQNKISNQADPNVLQDQAQPNKLTGQQQTPSPPPYATTPTFRHLGGLNPFGIFKRLKGAGGKRKFLDASSYLQRLFRRSAIMSIVSSLAGALTTAIGFVTTAIAGALTAISAVLTAIAVKIAAGIGVIGLGVSAPVLVVVGIVALGVAVFISIIVGACNVPGLGAILNFGGFCPSSVTVTVPKNPEGVTVVKQGPFSVDNGENIQYSLTVGYDSDTATIPPEELYLIDIPFYEYTFVSADGVYKPLTDDSGRDYLQWNLAENDFVESDMAPQSRIFKFTVKPTQQDIKAINVTYVATEYVEVEVTILEDSSSGGGGSEDTPGSLTEGRNSAPTNNRCGGQWNVGSHPNFGDPVCSYTPEKFSAYIKEVEIKDKNVEFWEDISISEGGSPRIGGNINVLGGGGAGTFQMIPSTGILHNHGPGKWPGPAGPSTPHGDVTWQRQIEQAVGWNNYLNRLSPSRNFMYWGTAYCLCYFDSYRNSGNGWCDDIIKQKATRCPYQCYPDYPSNGSCSIFTDRLAEKRGNEIRCRQYQCNIGTTGRDANIDKPWN